MYINLQSGIKIPSNLQQWYSYQFVLSNHVLRFYGGLYKVIKAKILT